MPVVIDDRSNINSMLMQWMQTAEARKRERERLAQQQGQFDQSLGMQKSQFEQTYGLDKQRTDAQVGRDVALTDQSKYQVSSDRAKSVIANTVPILKKYDQSGDMAGKARFAQQVLDRYPDDPEIAALFGPLVTEQPPTNIDKYAADMTGKAASGDQNAQANNFTFRMATGEQMNAPVFGDQQQREAGPEQHGRFLDIEGGLAPTANVTAQIAGQERIAAGDRASRERMAAAGGHASKFGVQPLNPSSAVAAAGEDVLRGGDITRVPFGSRMAVFEYVAQKGGKALPKEVANQIRGQIAAETALDEIATAFERYASANDPKELAKEAVNLRAKVYGTIPLLARGIGHTGVLTQQDVDSVAASILGAKGVNGLALSKAMPDETRQRISGMKGQFAEIQNRLLQDLIPQGMSGAKTVTRAELQAMGATEQEAAQAGYVVVD